MAFSCLDGVYLSKQENEFVHHVMDDLELKQLSALVLLFPPLPSRLRYLIHRTMEDVPELSTFSVGESWNRRVVVCEMEEDSDLEGSNSHEEHKPPVASRRRRPKRPDKPLYMPRAARKRLTLQKSQANTEDQQLPSSAHCSTDSLCNNSSDSCSCPEATGITASSGRQEVFPGLADGVPDSSEDRLKRCTQEQEDTVIQGLQEDEGLAREQMTASLNEMTLEEDEKDDAPDVGHTDDTSTDTEDVVEEVVFFISQQIHLNLHKYFSLRCFLWHHVSSFSD
uniref:R3H domain and coiled-coil containing 1 n=1 Tax=Salarias fasciatus TaxID=181472 RepID=A0A672HE64_SALFA